MDYIITYSKDAYDHIIRVHEIPSTIFYSEILFIFNEDQFFGPFW